MAHGNEKTQKESEFDALAEEFSQRLRETLAGVPGVIVMGPLAGDEMERFLEELFSGNVQSETGSG